MNEDELEIYSDELEEFQSIVSLVTSSNANFSNLAKLAGLDLKTDFIGADLRQVNLCGCDLSRADLSGANLNQADLSGANLSEANLSGADLSFANLSLANLSSTNLSSTNLSSTNLSSTNLSSTNLSGANLSGAILPVPNFKDANLVSLKEKTQVKWIYIVNNFLDELAQTFNRYIRQDKLNQTLSLDDIKAHIILDFHRKMVKKTLVYDEVNQCFYTVKDGIYQKIQNLKIYLRVFGTYVIRDKTRKLCESVYPRDAIDTSNKFLSLDHIDVSEIKEVMCQELTGVDCQILNLSFFEDYNTHDISRILFNEGYGNYSPDTIRQRKERALKKLKEIFKERY
jgi:uncharacterized protein YjbI with pentapeptide repeats